LSGFQRIRNLIFSENYQIEKAITHASKTAYMATLIKHNASSFDKFEHLQQLTDWTISEPFNTNYASSYNRTWQDEAKTIPIRDTMIFYDPKTNPLGYLALNPNGRISREEKPAYVSLSHELIHALGNMDGTAQTGQMNWPYTNEQGVNRTVIDESMEELATIGLISGRRITENMILTENGLLTRGSYQR